jgi:uncharacterized protein YoxC
MRTHKYFILISTLGVLALAPVVSHAAPTTSNSQREAAQLFQRIQADAVGAKTHADRLQTDATNYLLDWQVHAMLLSSIRHDIRDMHKAMSQLQAIRASIPPAEQRKADQVDQTIADLSINANDAIRFLDNNRETLWQPVYHTYARNIYKESRMIAKETR